MIMIRHSWIAQFLTALRLASSIVVMLLCAPSWAAITPNGDVVPSPVTPNTTVTIGNQGVGTLIIDAGSSLNSSFMQIGQGTNGVGTAIVRDPGSMWRVTGGEIGNSGIGRLEVRNGATVEIPSPANIFRLGNNTTGNGTVVVDGQGTVLQVVAPFTVGQQGAALLQATNGAIVNVPTHNTVIGLGGRVELDNALMRTNGIQNSGTIIGSGELDVLSSGTVTNQGRIEAGPGDWLLLGGSTSSSWQNNGAMVADGGELEFRRLVNNASTAPTIGRITLQDGTIRFSLSGTTQQGLQNSSLLAALGGENQIHGRILNTSTGDIVATNHSTVIFHHDVTSQGTITVAAGSTAIFLEDLLLNGGTLFADLAGAEGFGHAEVYGQAQLGSGSLQLGMSSGYQPMLGDTFRLLTSAGGIVGTPSLASTPNPSNVLKWDLDADANQLVVSVVPALEGDYNANGIVDAPDYLVWRKLLNATGPGLAADGDDNNIVNFADYNLWVNNFGNTIDSLGSGAAQIPEPTTAWLFSSCLAISLIRRRKLHYRGW